MFSNNLKEKAYLVRNLAKRGNVSKHSMKTIYNDNYPTCTKTYATLRICSRSSDVSERLNLNPTRTAINDNLNIYLYSTENIVQSKDVRRHIDYLIEMFKSKVEILNEIQSEKSKIDIMCYWLSENGNGGPILSPKQLTELGKLNIEIWFDVYGL